MSTEDFSLTLFDRIEVIKKVINEVGQDNCYISFSGGKDSTVLHYLIDEAIPGNTIPRVFINTGIEYNSIVKFVREFINKDSRFTEVKPTQSIKQVLETYGYPFKSKIHSNYIYLLQHGSTAISVKKYFDGTGIMYCPKKLMYQKEGTPFPISSECCNRLKKHPAHEWEKANHRKVKILGLKMEEGGQRALKKGCVVFDSKTHKMKVFKPLNPVSEVFEDWYIETRNIRLCELYYPPYSLERTGCKGCPYNPHLRQDLEMMEELLPNEAKQCEIIWKPVYDEYRRINYKLKKEDKNKQGKQLKLF